MTVTNERIEYQFTEQTVEHFMENTHNDDEAHPRACTRVSKSNRVSVCSLL